MQPEPTSHTEQFRSAVAIHSEQIARHVEIEKTMHPNRRAVDLGKSRYVQAQVVNIRRALHESVRADNALEDFTRLDVRMQRHFELLREGARSLPEPPALSAQMSDSILQDPGFWYRGLRVPEAASFSTEALRDSILNGDSQLTAFRVIANAKPGLASQHAALEDDIVAFHSWMLVPLGRIERGEGISSEWLAGKMSAEMERTAARVSPSMEYPKLGLNTVRRIVASADRGPVVDRGPEPTFKGLDVGLW